MIRLWSLALQLALHAGPGAPPAGEIVWSTTNQQATILANQDAAPEGCRLQVIHDSDHQILWSKDACFGGHGDAHFLSPNGERLIVLVTYPPLASQQPGGWRRVPVAWLFDRGSLVQEAVAAQFVKDGSEVREGISHFKWLQGAEEVPGVPPRLTADGTGVALEAIDGAHRELSFNGFKLPPPAPEPKPRHPHY